MTPSDASAPAAVRADRPTTDADATPPRHLRLIVVLGAISAFGPLSLDMYLPAFPSLADDFSASEADVQTTLTACLIGLALGQLFAGSVSDARGRRKPLIIGLAAYAVASLLCAFAPSIPALGALRLVQGLAGGAGIVIARAVVRDLYSPAAAARVFSSLMLVNGLAPILAPVLGGQLLRWTDWRGVFTALAVIGTVLLAVGVLALPESLPRERRRSSGFREAVGSFRVLLTDRLFLGHALTGGCAFAALFAYISGSSFALQEVYGLDAQAFSLVFGGNSVGIMVLGQCNLRLLRRHPPQVLLRCGLALCATGGVGLLVAVACGAGLPAVLVALFLLVASIGLILPNTTALSMAGHPEAAGTASALLGLLQYALGGLAAPLVGLGHSGSAMPMALAVASCATASVAVYVLCVPRRGTDAKLTGAQAA